MGQVDIAGRARLFLFPFLFSHSVVVFSMFVESNIECT